MGQLTTEEIYEQIIKSMVVSERLRLVERIVHDLSTPANGESVSNYSWASLRGIAPNLLDGQDAQPGSPSAGRVGPASRVRTEPLGMKLADALARVKFLFLDTAPVIYHVESNAAYQPLTDRILEAIDNGTIEAVASSVTLAECLGQPYQRGDMALVAQFRNVIATGQCAKKL